jgi:phage recombination protein Bet
VSIVSSNTTRRAIDTLREQLAPKANDDELNWLAAVGQRLGLDPIAGHLVLIPRWDKRANREVHRPQITADGRLVLAERTGELDGFDGPEWTGTRDAQGVHHWVDLWDDDDVPHAARCIVYRKGRTHPANGTVRWKEFAQYNSNGVLMPTWKQMPSHMLGKVALSLGLRRAFGDVIPSDADVDDDFASYERAPLVDTATGEIVAPADVEPPAARPSAVVAPSAADPLVVRIEDLDQRSREHVRDFIESRKLPWPTDVSAVRTAVERELTRIEAEAAEERDTYGDESAQEPPPPRREISDSAPIGSRLD